MGPGKAVGVLPVETTFVSQGLPVKRRQMVLAVDPVQMDTQACAVVHMWLKDIHA